MKSDLEKEIEALELEFNSIQCPECGGKHEVHINRTGLFPHWIDSFRMIRCDGYRRLVHRKINDLKRRHGIKEFP